jgi:hypothetical protein
MANLITHGQCGKQWSGLTNGHCSACHETFSSGAFDKHQHIRDGVITCSTKGFVPWEMPWGILWKLPGPDKPWWRDVKTVELPDDAA